MNYKSSILETLMIKGQLLKLLKIVTIEQKTKTAAIAKIKMTSDQDQRMTKTDASHAGFRKMPDADEEGMIHVGKINYKFCYLMTFIASNISLNIWKIIQDY